MARRRSEPPNTTPAAELDNKSSTSQQHCDPPAYKNHKGKSYSVKKGNRSRARHFRRVGHLAHPAQVLAAAPRTRAQARHRTDKVLSIRIGPVTRQQRQSDLQNTPCPSNSASPTLPASASSRGATVAATSPRATPASGRGPATRSRSDLRLRERVKVETPDSSSNGPDMDSQASEVNHDSSSGRGDAEVCQNDGPQRENENEDGDIGREGGEGDDDDMLSAEDRDSDGVENGGLNVLLRAVEESVAGSHQGGESEDEEVDVEGDEEEEVDDDVESCHCTSNWSCGGHAGQKRAGPCSSSKLQGKRRLPSDPDEDSEIGGVSPTKKGCRTRSALRPLAGTGLGTSSPSKPTRQRIPSREHPPPKLDQWLETFKSWSNAERMMALDDLIALCDPSQVRHMMHVIEPQFQRDFISLLPKELALYVLSFLEPRDLLRAAQTCRYWHILCEDNLLWREKCREEGIDEVLVYGSRPRRRLGPRSPCKALYMRQSKIEMNWRTGTSQPPKILKGHDDHVITCLEFCGHRIVSGSDDNTLKVWSVVSGKCLRTLIGHTGGVWSSQMSGNIIISGSTDRTLKVWNADSGVCKHTLYGHTSTVRCMSLCGNKVVSGSRDATLRVWDIETGQCLHVLMGHVAAVRCVQYDGRRVVSGAYDYTVRVWDPETEACLHTLQGHSNRVYSLQFDGVHVVSGSLDTSIRVWDVETGACLHTLIGHQSLTSGLELKDNILVSGNADSTVKVWDITTGQCLQTLQGPHKHQSAVTCLQFSKKFVITSSDDGTVKIWDLKTGEFLRNLVSLDSGGSGGVVWRLRCSNTKLVCAVGSRNGTEETKLMVLDFDVEEKKQT